MTFNSFAKEIVTCKYIYIYTRSVDCEYKHRYCTFSYLEKKNVMIRCEKCDGGETNTRGYKTAADHAILNAR